jgi:ubiquinone/menaquinone biosynthesis C-methylase UbiE
MSAISRLGLDTWSSGETHPSLSQQQTEKAFAFKWAKRDTYESPEMHETARAWLFERYCAGDPAKRSEWLGESSKIILDVGCGAGFSALLFWGELLKQHDYLGIDVSDSVLVARQRFDEQKLPGDFLKSDLFCMPVPDDSVDILFSEGVLHHTDSTEKALKFLAKKLKPDGRFLFYVYAKKSVMREFADDIIRKKLQDMTDEQAWEALKPLTQLGIELGEKEIEIEIKEKIPLLEIPMGKWSLQRFFYWFFCKTFYRQGFSFDEMNHINFDWFRPLNCHRQTSEDVQKWCQESHLFIEHLDAQEAGITVVARKIAC